MQSIRFRIFVTLLSIIAGNVFATAVYGLYSNETLSSFYGASSLSADIAQKLQNEERVNRVVKRRLKRYVAFPEGSSFTCAVCATVGVVGSPSYDYLSYGLNWGIAYDLPNETWILDHLHGFGNIREPAAIAKRRNRRALYLGMENMMDSMGYNGRDCILRALCESKSYFQSDKLGMIPELLRTIFSLPKTRLFTREIQENADIQHYNDAYFSDEDEDCEFKYPCSFSLLELAMGRYAEPPDYYGD